MPEPSAECYDQIFVTQAGPVAVMADIYIAGDTVELRELSFYPVGSERLNMGTRLIRQMYRLIEADLRSIGYKRLRITAHRISGASPGRNVLIHRSLR